MKLFSSVFLTTLALLFLCDGLAAQQPKAKQAKSLQPAFKQPEQKKLSREELEKQFSEKLSNTILTGAYTRDGEDLKDLKADRYELKRVEKLQGDTWNFVAHIKYGDLDAVMPIPLTVLWAGDTPMITMTNTEVPEMGTFTVRIMFYGNRYAGTWQHGDVGGHMFGKIEKAPPEDKAKSETEKTK